MADGFSDDSGHPGCYSVDAARTAPTDAAPAFQAALRALDGPSTPLYMCIYIYLCLFISICMFTYSLYSCADMCQYIFMGVRGGVKGGGVKAYLLTN